MNTKEMTGYANRMITELNSHDIVVLTQSPVEKILTKEELEFVHKTVRLHHPDLRTTKNNRDIIFSVGKGVTDTIHEKI